MEYRDKSLNLQFIHNHEQKVSSVLLNTIVNKCIKVTESTSFKSDSILGLDLWQSLQTIHNSTVCIKHQKQSFFKQNKIIFKNPEKNYKYEHSNFEMSKKIQQFWTI